MHEIHIQNTFFPYYYKQNEDFLSNQIQAESTFSVKKTTGISDSLRPGNLRCINSTHYTRSTLQWAASSSVLD